MREWLEPQKVDAPEPLRTAVGGHPLVAETLVRRGVATVETALAFLDPGAYQPAPSTDLPDLVRAAERIEDAIRRGERICVWGDFDVDGQTATTLLVSTLRDLGAEVSFHIPHRQRESHGVNLPVLERLIYDGTHLILTCDTGVAAHEAVAYAQERGVDFVVTDHHDLPPVLPEAVAVVNPKRLSDTHPLRELPGVGCAFKLAEELYERACRSREARQHLDLVALGIVADIALQVGDVRYLLQRGLEELRRTDRLGLQVLMELAAINPSWLTEEHIGFELAPRLNALGRLADANVAVEFLTTEDQTRARTLAAELDGLNAQRKLLVTQIAQAAQAQVERDPSLLEYAALVLSHPSWPGGVVGIVASRLAEQYNRPVILLSAPPGELARGSARSIEGCNVTAAITAQEEMLVRYGGHPMAAGLSIDAERIPEFRRALSRTVEEMLGEVKKPSLPIDGYLPLSDLSLDLVQEIERLAPFGAGNPPLTLVSQGLSLVGERVIGRSQDHRLVIVRDEEGVSQRVIWWQGADRPLPEGRFDLAYTVRASDYRGERELQVVWVDARPVEEPAVTLRQEPHPLEVVDYRREIRPRRVLKRLREVEDLQVWAEAGARAEVAGRDRYELGASETLVVWTIPPGPGELAAAMERVAPGKVILFGINPDLDHPEQFLNRLAGLVIHALRVQEGRVKLSTLAAATAQREVTVRAGLAWLEARGHIIVQGEEDGDIRLARGDQDDRGVSPQVVAYLEALLKETAAYRAHFAQADKGALVEAATA